MAIIERAKCPECMGLHPDQHQPYCPHAKKAQPALRAIGPETATDKIANEVRGSFGEECDNMLKNVDRMMAYFIVCFDEKGVPTYKLVCEDKFPIPQVLLPDIVKQCCIQYVYEE